MRAPWLVARNHLRRHRLALAVVGVLTAVSSALTLGAFAGAVRTDGALERALEEAQYPQGLIDIGKIDPALVEKVRDLPQVSDAASGAFVAVRPSGTDKVAGIDVVGVLPLDDKAFYDIGRPRIFEGRMPDPARSGEVALSPDLARDLGLQIGDRITVEAYTQTQAFAIFTSPESIDPKGLVIDAEVVGVGHGINELTGGEAGDFGVIVLSPALFQDIGAPELDFSAEPPPLELGFFRLFLQVLLEPGQSDSTAVIDGVFDIYGGAATNAFSEERSIVFAEARDTVKVEATALFAVALVAAIASLLAVGQTAGRQVALFAEANQATLRAIGFTRWQRALASLIPVVITVVAGTVLGIAFATAVSTFFPLGLAGKLEPAPGIHFDASRLVPGALLLVGALILRTGISAWSQSGARRSAAAGQGVTTRMSSPSLSIGIAFATNPGRGRSRVPLRAAVVGAVIGTAGVVGALTFAASLNTLVETPRLYGDPWDFQIPLQAEGGRIMRKELPRLEADERIVAIGRYRGLEIRLGAGKPISGILLESVKGEIGPTLLSGRLPASGDEIAINAAEAADRDIQEGNEVEATMRKTTERLKVVGRLVGTAFPGFVVTPATAASLGARSFDELGIILRIAAGTDEKTLEKDLRTSFAEVYSPTPPPLVNNLTGVKQFPYLVAVFLAVLAIAAVGHLLITGVKRRSRDLAILKVIGFRRRQLRETVVIQGVIVAALGVAIGLPLGIALGRTSWSIVASGLHIVEDPTFPVAPLLLLPPLAVALAIVLALAPARRAAELSPALVLRSE